MTSEIQVYSKDMIKMNILKDVLLGTVRLSLQVSDGANDDYAKTIHQEGKRVNVYGKFNISEDSSGEILTIRPIMIDSPLKIQIESNSNISDKKVSIVRSTTKETEQEFIINCESTCIQLIPQGKQHYTLIVHGNGNEAPLPGSNSIPQRKSTPPDPIIEQKPNQALFSVDHNAHNAESSNTPSQPDDRFQGFDLPSGPSNQDSRFTSFEINPHEAPAESTNNVNLEPAPQYPDSAISQLSPDNTIQNGSGDIQRIEQEISAIELKQQQLAQKKQYAIAHLEKIEEEYKKDYASLEHDLAEIKARMEADISVIEHYKDQDVVPVEIIFEEIRLKLEKAEEQIRFFIEAKQKKTMEIENEIKSNKKQ